jgi:hypothetical protein
VTLIATFAILAGLLQALGYLVYMLKSVNGDIVPNPLTWIMFAYGTGILCILEFNREASLALLILPVTCAGLSLLVAGFCIQTGMQRSTSKNPLIEWVQDVLSDRVGLVALATDVTLTIGYVIVWGASKQGIVSDGVRSTATLLFLILTNASTFVSFVPLVLETVQEPEKEHWLPWVTWCLAYITLGAATIMQDGLEKPELLLYPTSCAFLHGAIGLLSLWRRGHGAKKSLT